MKQTPKILVLLSIICVSVTQAQIPDPGWKPQRYLVGSWSLPLSKMDYKSESDPTTGFWACSACGQGEPSWGYPYHSGFISGVSDTCLLIVIIKNSDTNSVSLGGTPENWFLPIVYYSYSDVMPNRIWKDTSDFNFRFDHWSYNSDMISKPSSLSQNQQVELNYYVWGLPAGNGVIHVEKALSAPSGLSVKRIGVGQYWKDEPKAIKDTINAYVATLWRAFNRNQWGVAQQWADSILAKEDSSLAAWDLKGSIYLRQWNTSGALDAFYRVISIYENNHDPLIDLGDTLHTTEDERDWAIDRYNHAIYWRWRLVNNITNQVRE